MGMYDDIRCLYPLPGMPPAFLAPDYRFQTKDLECEMGSYLITEDGHLICEVSSWIQNLGPIGDDGEFTRAPRPEPVAMDDFTGTIDFYAGNVRMSGAAIYTANGEDAEWVSYRATIILGRVDLIVETERTREPALPMPSFEQQYPTPTPEELAEWQRLERESLIGRTMFLSFGGREVEAGEIVEVVAESSKNWCLRKPDDELYVVDRRSRGRILYDSMDDAMAARDERRAEMDREREKYEELLRSRAEGDVTEESIP